MEWDGISPGKGGGLIYTGHVFWADSKIARANALFLGVDQGGGGHFISGASLFLFSDLCLSSFFSLSPLWDMKEYPLYSS